MTHYVGLDVSQKLTAICVVDETGRRQWRGQCTSDAEPIERTVRRHGGEDARIGIETGPMTPWLVHELRGRGLAVTCLDARHASAALKMQINKTDQNDAEGLAQIMRTGWYRSVHVKSFDSHRARTLLSAPAPRSPRSATASNSTGASEPLQGLGSTKRRKFRLGGQKRRLFHIRHTGTTPARSLTSCPAKLSFPVCGPRIQAALSSSPAGTGVVACIVPS